METLSALLALCAGNSPVIGEFPAQRPVTRSFDVLVDLHLNKRLNKQWCGWRSETPSCPLWRHCNDIMVKNHPITLKFGRSLDCRNTGTTVQFKCYDVNIYTRDFVISWYITRYKMSYRAIEVLKYVWAYSDILKKKNSRVYTSFNKPSFINPFDLLIHPGWVTQICISNLCHLWLIYWGRVTHIYRHWFR